MSPQRRTPPTVIEGAHREWSTELVNGDSSTGANPKALVEVEIESPAIERIQSNSQLLLEGSQRGALDRLRTLLEAAETGYTAWRKFSREITRSEIHDPEVDALRRDVDETICEAVTLWELLGQPAAYADRVQALPGYAKWHNQALRDPATEELFAERIEALDLDYEPELAPIEVYEPECDISDISPRSRFVPGGQFIFDGPDRTAAIWGAGDDVLWARGEGLLAVADTGLGKTTITVQLVAGRLGIIDEVLGYPVEPDDRPVLYLAMDRPAQIRRLMRRFFAHHDVRNILDDRLVVWDAPLPVPTTRNPAILAEMAEKVGAGTVIVDSLKDAAVKFSDDESGGMINRSHQMVLAEGIELAVLHHNRKRSDGGSKEPKSLEDVFGSTFIAAGMGSVIALHGTPGDAEVGLRHLKQPVDAVGPLRITHDYETGISRISAGFDPLIYLQNRGANGATARDAAQAMFSTHEPDNNQVARARRKLDALAERMPESVSVVAGAKGGSSGGTPTRWVAKAITQAITQGF